MSDTHSEAPRSAAEHGTTKLYLDDYSLVVLNALVVSVDDTEEGTVRIVLDKTAFYPGGGGQACDLGSITWPSGSLTLTHVSKDDDGIVYHDGQLQGKRPDSGLNVECHVDEPRRSLNSRLHSAGHLLDLAVSSAGFAWAPGKGAHYPHMSFVEYTSDSYDGNKTADCIAAIQKEINTIVQAGGSVAPNRMTPDEARTRSKYIPEEILQRYDMIHVATYNDQFDICCGGTHVVNITDIGHVTVERIKKKSGNIRVSYTVTN